MNFKKCYKINTFFYEMHLLKIFFKIIIKKLRFAINKIYDK